MLFIVLIELDAALDTILLIDDPSLYDKSEENYDSTFRVYSFWSEFIAADDESLCINVDRFASASICDFFKSFLKKVDLFL